MWGSAGLDHGVANILGGTEEAVANEEEEERVVGRDVVGEAVLGFDPSEEV